MLAGGVGKEQVLFFFFYLFKVVYALVYTVNLQQLYCNVLRLKGRIYLLVLV